MQLCSKCGHEKSPGDFYASCRTICKDCTRERSRQHREDNLDRHRQRARDWQKAHPGRTAAHKRAWAQRNPEAGKLWRKANPEKMLGYRRRWERTTGGKESIARQNRRRRNFEHSERWTFQQINDRTEGLCGLCGLLVEPNQNHHYDHVIPLALGGHDVPNNVILAHATCNLKKGATVVALAVEPKDALPIAWYLERPGALSF